MLQDGSLSAGHARALLGASEPERLALQIVVKELSVRQTEALARSKGARRPSALDPNLAMVERDLSNRLGLRVAIRPSGRGGSITLRYSRAPSSSTWWCGNSRATRATGELSTRYCGIPR